MTTYLLKPSSALNRLTGLVLMPGVMVAATVTMKNGFVAETVAKPVGS